MYIYIYVYITKIIAIDNRNKYISYIYILELEISYTYIKCHPGRVAVIYLHVWMICGFYTLVGEHKAYLDCLGMDGL